VKGSYLLWWNMLLPQLNMVIEELSWDLFEGMVPGKVLVQGIH
jgi:hypothetical protein